MREVREALIAAQATLIALSIEVDYIPADLRTQSAFIDNQYDEVIMCLRVGPDKYYRSQRIRGHEAEHAKYILTDMIRDLVCTAMRESWPVF